LILDKIISYKNQEVENKKKRVSIDRLLEKLEERPKLRDFKEAIISKDGKIRIIAEIKKASPSIGIIREDLDVVKLAKDYQEGGASAISVVTDKEFFKGELLNIFKAKEATKLPVLCKDFILDFYQIVEAALFGADAVLLITSFLSKDKIKELMESSKNIGITPIVEIHNEEDLKKALAVEAEIIGINNRNLHTFIVDKTTTFRLKFEIPKDKIVISESGINSRDDIALLEEKGISAALIGEFLLKSEDVVFKLRELLGI
jgi:indole-3-glycerol phosphate synthase